MRVIVSLFTLRIILRKNTFDYPYGTGKLENFATFVYGLFIIPLAVGIFVAAVKRYLHPPATIDLWLAQFFLLALLRMAILAAWITRLWKRHVDHSPLMSAYYLDYRISFINDIAILCTLFLSLILSSQGWMHVSVMIDMAVATLIATYYLWIGCHFIVRNFRALIDLPLDEAFQLSILRCLSKDIDEYDGIGMIYTRMSGSTRIVQIELKFRGSATIAKIDALRRSLENKLCGDYGNISFQLIPIQMDVDHPHPA